MFSLWVYFNSTQHPNKRNILIPTVKSWYQSQQHALLQWIFVETCNVPTVKLSLNQPSRTRTCLFSSSAMPLKRKFVWLSYYCVLLNLVRHNVLHSKFAAIEVSVWSSVQYRAEKQDLQRILHLDRFTVAGNSMLSGVCYYHNRQL